IQIYGSTTTFFGKLTENSGGTIKVTAGAVYFLGNASISGLYTSDPSDNYFTGLTTTPGGTVTGGTADRFFMTSNGALINGGRCNDPGTISDKAVTNPATCTQTATLTETATFTNSGTATLGGIQNWSTGTTFTNTAGTATFQS